MATGEAVRKDKQGESRDREVEFSHPVDLDYLAPRLAVGGSSHSQIKNILLRVCTAVWS